MVQRVLIDADGVRMSLPGIDVTTAADHELAFTSEWAELGLVHASGDCAFGAEVLFPALPYVPIVLAAPLDPSGYPMRPVIDNTAFDGPALLPRVVVRVDGVTNSDPGGGGDGVDPLSMRYIVLRLPIEAPP